jgi:outer membrane protein, heavy metal efflux system
MFKYLLIALVLTGAALPAQAEEVKPDQAQEPGVLVRLEEKLRQHPEIEAYIHRAESSSHYAEGELGLPDPMLFVQEEDYPIGGNSSRQEEQKMIGFSQRIPAIGTRSAKSGRMAAESRKTRLLGEYAFAAMKARMISTLANLTRVKEQEKLLNQQATLLGSERTSLKGRIAANQAGLSQLSMSQVESADVELMRAELEEEKHEIEAMLINMLGEVPKVTLPDIEMAKEDNADKTYPVHIAEQDITAANKDVDLREAEYGPNFEIETGYGRMVGGDNSGSIRLGLSIPLWAAQSQKPKLEGAKASVRAAQSDQTNIRREIVQKLDHLKAQIEASAKKLELLRRKISLLNASSTAQTREYEAGKADFAMSLKTRREVLAARYQLATEQAQHTTLVADFNRYFPQGESK